MDNKYKLVSTVKKAISLSIAEFNAYGVKSAIAPFGFELLDIYDVPASSLRRIYIYTEAHDESHLLGFGKYFITQMKVLYPEIGNRITFIKHESKITNVPSETETETETYIQIYISNVQGDSSLLETYSDYINLSSKYIANQTHPQLLKYKTNNVARGHILQLFLMTLRIEDCNTHSSEEVLVKEFIRNLNMSWDKNKKMATPKEIEILNDVLVPFFCKVEQKNSLLGENEDSFLLEGKALHGDKFFTRRSPLTRVNKYRNFVSSKYNYI